jgi:hypothetical protein
LEYSVQSEASVSFQEPRTKIEHKEESDMQFIIGPFPVPDPDTISEILDWFEEIFG